MQYKTKSERAKCLECGNVIEYGRPDKKFCCSNCKNNYNNRRSRSSRQVKLKILSALERNYSILDNLLRFNVTSLTVTEMQRLGFIFDYVTSYQKVNRHDVFLCFDISFSVIGGRVTSIEKLSINLRVDPFDGPEFFDRGDNDKTL